MYIAYVELNLQDGFGVKVRFGPYRFPKWGPREKWESTFRRELTKYGRSLVPPFEFKPNFQPDAPVLADEIMEPPPVAEVIRNVKILWDGRTVVPSRS